jgi:myo-inositol-1(or 4)-monophosphatase
MLPAKIYLISPNDSFNKITGTSLMQPMANIALRAARNAGQIIGRALDRPDLTRVQETSPQHYVTNVGKQVEREIIKELQHTYPDHGFITEVLGDQSGDCRVVWIIDPLNGMANFVRGIPHFSISIACQIKGKLEHAVILDPIRHEEFTASRGQGARVNDTRIRTNRKVGLKGALIANGTLDNTVDVQKALELEVGMAKAGASLRKSGCPGLDLAYVAAGRLDAIWLSGMPQWEVAAGILMIQEAGGLISDFSGAQSFMASGNIAAGAPKVFKPLLQQVQKNLG